MWEVAPDAGPPALPVTEGSVFGSLALSTVDAEETEPTGEGLGAERPDEVLTDWEFSSDSRTWSPVRVPDNFARRDTALVRHFDPMWYRRRVDRAGRVVFDAVDYFASVRLDGEELVRHEGFFAPFAVDVEAPGVLEVEVHNPLDPGTTEEMFLSHRKRLVKGLMNHHDSRPGGMPGDIPRHWTPEKG